MVSRIVCFLMPQRRAERKRPRTAPAATARDDSGKIFGARALNLEQKL